MHKFLDKIITALGSLFIVKTGIEASQKGKVARTIISLTLTVFIVILLIGSIVGLVKGLFAGRTSFISLLKHDFGYAIMMLLITLITFVVTILLAQIVLYHARSIAGGEESPYTASSILSDILKMLGEMVFLLISAGGIIAFVASFGRMGRYMMPRFMDTGEGILIGLAALIIAPLVGSLIQMVFYFFAERIRVFMDIAENTKK